jgi:hypothetical protein
LKAVGDIDVIVKTRAVLFWISLAMPEYRQKARSRYIISSPMAVHSVLLGFLASQGFDRCVAWSETSKAQITIVWRGCVGSSDGMGRG